MLRAPILALTGLFSCENTWMKNLLTVKGDGTAGNPFRVYDVDTLQHVGNHDSGIYSEWTLNAHYIQTKNIDMNGVVNVTAIGDDTNPFTGSFDGNGKTISNLYIDKNGFSYQGFFGYINGSSVVKNVRLANCDIRGGQFTGSIVGRNNGIVQNCSAMGYVTVSGDYVGGVIGINYGTVRNCYSGIDTLSNAYHIGGVVGSNEGSSAKVENCYATGSVNGFERVGGIVGNNSGTVQNCVALNSDVLGGASVGRVVGYGGTDLKNNYASVNISGSWSAIGINANDGEDIPSGEQYTENWWKTAVWNTTSPAFAWDFAKVWRWDSGITLPVLRN